MQSPRVGICGIDQGAAINLTPLIYPSAQVLGDGDCYGKEKPKKAGGCTESTSYSVHISNIPIVPAFATLLTNM